MQVVKKINNLLISIYQPTRVHYRVTQADKIILKPRRVADPYLIDN